MGLDLEYIDGQTPIDEDEKEGLLIPTIATRRELDEFEQKNIEEAVQWMLFTRTFKAATVFSEKFICDLHQRMFGSVWAWAGQYRKTNKNLGVDKFQIPAALKALGDDALFWFENKTYPPDFVALRFKHRLVSIHCFPNGNGRHSRLMADIIINKLYDLPLFSWGAGDLQQQGDARIRYLQALREADNNSFQALLAFARS